MKKLKVKQHHFQMNSSVKLPEGNSTPEQIIVSLRLLIKVNCNKISKISVNSDLSTAIDGEVGPCRKYDELDRACFPWHVSDDFHSSRKAENFWHFWQSKIGATFESHVAALRWWRNWNPSLSTVSLNCFELIIIFLQVERICARRAEIKLRIFWSSIESFSASSSNSLPNNKSYLNWNLLLYH